MPASPVELSAADWAAIRARWEVGSSSLRALAREFGIDEGTIRHRRGKEGGTRDEEALERIQARGQVRALEVEATGSAGVPHSAGSVPRGVPHSAPPAEPAEVLDAEARAELREAAIDQAADVIARTPGDHLDRAYWLKARFVAFDTLLPNPSRSRPRTMRRRWCASSSAPANPGSCWRTYAACWSSAVRRRPLHGSMRTKRPPSIMSRVPKSMA
jgi:hypothetical protein